MSDRLKRGEWEAVLRAPFHIYALVAAADGEPTEAHYRRLVDEVAAARGAFPEGSLGAVMAAALAVNMNALWETFRSSGRSPEDGLVRARKALKRVTDEESEAVRDWWLTLAVRIAEASRMMGMDAVSENESQSIAAIAGWLQRPVRPSVRPSGHAPA